MAIIVATSVFTFSVLITLVIARPTRNPENSGSDSCNIHVTEGSQPTHNYGVAGQCVNIGDARIPTKLRIECNSSLRPSHLLQTFSRDDCPDPSAVANKPVLASSQEPSGVQTSTSLVLNERKPICSFRLGLNPFEDSPVKVAFQDSTNIAFQISMNSSETCIINLCDNYPAVMYAVSLGLYDEKDGSRANNHVHLFSDRNCEERLAFHDGTHQIEFGMDLVKLTKLYNLPVKSVRLSVQ